MKCKDCKEVMCKHRSTNAEMECVLQVDVLKKHHSSINKVWHDSNTEQPKRGSSIVVVKGRSGDVIDRVVEVYPNRIWAYLDDLLSLNHTPTNVSDQEQSVSKDLNKFAEEWDESLYLSDAVIAGANWQKDRMIAKACEWMDKEAMRYVITRHGLTGLDASMTEDFRKHLEED